MRLTTGFLVREQDGWKLQFTRNTNTFGVVGQKIENFSLEVGRKDFLKWKETENGVFSIKTCYRMLSTMGIRKAPNFRENFVPTKVCFFAWEA